MSYILDALKKSEQQRKRDSAPTLHAPQITTYVDNRKPILFYAFIIMSLVLTAALFGFLYAWLYNPNKQVNTTASVAQTAPIPTSTNPSPPAIPVQTPKSIVIQAESLSNKKHSLQNARKLIKKNDYTDSATKNEFTNQQKNKNAPAEPLAAEKVMTPAMESLPTTPTTSPDNSPAENLATENTQNHSLIDISELPAAIQQEVPKMNIAGIAYSPMPKERSVGINERLLQEGDYLAPSLKLEKINANGLIFSYKGYHFRQGL